MNVAVVVANRCRQAFAVSPVLVALRIIEPSVGDPLDNADTVKKLVPLNIESDPPKDTVGVDRSVTGNAANTFAPVVLVAKPTANCVNAPALLASRWQYLWHNANSTDVGRYSNGVATDPGSN
jgi:hypothetical protein